MCKFLAVLAFVSMSWAATSSAHETDVDPYLLSLQSKLMDALEKRDYQGYADLYLTENDGYVTEDVAAGLHEKLMKVLSGTFSSMEAMRWHRGYNAVACGGAVAMLTDLAVFEGHYVFVTHVFIKDEGTWRIEYLSFEGEGELVKAQDRYRASGIGQC